MLPLGLSLALFVFLAAVGRATLVVGRYRSGVLRAWLLAPTVGLAVLVLALMVLNQAGLPIGSFAGWLTAALGIASVVALVRSRPPFPRRALTTYAGAVAFMFLWTGWPALEFGFRWVSFANDDMVNYCLGADRFVDCGFWDVPKLADLAGLDYSRYFWFFHVPGLMRFGSEHLLAWLIGLTGMKGTLIFMPTILALGAAQLCALGALVLHRGRDRRWAALAVWLLAFSPLFMLGTLYQLIAQVGGLALLLITFALLVEPVRGSGRRPIVRRSILAALSAAALCIFYPEVTPFAALAFGGYVVLETVQTRKLATRHIVLAIYTLAGTMLLLRYNLIAYIYTLVHQYTYAVRTTDLSLTIFPYLLIPTGLSNLCGWMPFAHDFPEPAVSLSIVAGMGLLLAAMGGAMRECLRRTPVAILLLVQVAVAFRLYSGANDFGLYKIAMFAQPALMTMVVWWTLRLPRPAISAPCAVACLGLTMVPTAFYYTTMSLGTEAGGIAEARFASKTGLKLSPPPPAGARLLGTLDNAVAAKLAASEARGHLLSLVSRDFFSPDVFVDYQRIISLLTLHPHFKEITQTPALLLERQTNLFQTTQLWRTGFIVPRTTGDPDYYISLPPRLSLLNKFGTDPDAPINSFFVVSPAQAVENLLIFIHSGRGNHYYLGDRRRIAIFQQEPDLMIPGREFSGLGRFLLLRVERPTDPFYLRISATRTLLFGRTEWGQNVTVLAKEDQPLGRLGHGAFNRFIGPLHPVWHEGNAYIAIDFAEIPTTVADFRHGLKALYHTDVPLDSRRLIGWGRDISALSPAKYASLVRPKRIANFPQDLVSNNALEYSGVYEDGWLSPDCEFVLGAAGAGDGVRVRGMVPGIPGTALGTGQLLISINGAPEIRLPAPCGSFDWLVPVESPAATTRVRMHFTANAMLAGEDGRPVGSMLEVLEISPASTQAWDFTQTKAPRLATTGIDLDGWTAKAATLLLPARPQPAELVARIEYPGWGGSGQLLRVRIDGKVIATQNLAPGITEVPVALAASATPQTVELLCEEDFPLPAPDGRRRACRLLTVDLRLAPTA